MPTTASEGTPGAAQAAGAGPSLLYVVKQLELAVRAGLDEIVRAAGITALQYTALTVLDRHDGLSLAQLARHSFVTPQAAADLVANLERHRLARRDRNERNRREVIVRLTGEGRDLLARQAGPVAALEGQMLSGLGEAEAAQFRRYLDRCRRALGPGSG